MVIDTSAILAVLFQEPDAHAFAEAIKSDPVRLLSAVAALEGALISESRLGPSGGREFDLFLHRGHIDVVPFTADQAETARSAWRKFGKGRHPAALNLCDCCSYALAKTSGEALLFKGQDFSRTDVTPVLNP